MVGKIILGGVGLFVACCFFVAIEEEFKRSKQRKLDAKKDKDHEKSALEPPQIP